MRAKFRRYLYFGIIAILALALIIPFSAQPALGEELGNQEPVKIHDVQVDVSKEQVFEGEIFYVRASARVTLNQDVNFSTVVTAEINVIATHQETGNTLTLTHTSVSIGPFVGLKKGTTFTYTPLNIPLMFPSDAPVGEYRISAELVKVEPESVWNLVKDQVTSVSLDLGTTEYLGVSTPESQLSLSVPKIDLVLNPDRVPAGSAVEARLTATNPSEKDMTIPFSLYLKLPGKTEEPWKQGELSLAAGMSDSVSEYLSIPEAWQSLGTVDVIAEVASFSLGEDSVYLESPLRITRSFSIINLQLRATLKTSVEPSLLGLGYDAQSGYLIAEQVGLNGAIGIDNLSGWENSLDIMLHLEVIQSQGVQMVEEWETVDIRTGELYGQDLATQAKFIVDNPTAEGLGETSFLVQVNAEGGIQETFSLGISRIEGEGWYLDSQARLIDKTTGEAFAGSISGAQLPEEYLSKAAEEKTGELQEILGKVDSLIIDIQTFGDCLESGANILPTALKAYERLTQRGSSLMAELEMLEDQGILEGASLGKIDELANALQELAGLETLVHDKYGDNPTPKGASAGKFEETLGGQDSEQLGRDHDGDGLTTATELQLGYDPHVWDSQQSGVSDGEYLANSMAQGEDLDQHQQDFLSSCAGLYMFYSGETGLEGEDMKDYKDLTGNARQQTQQHLRNATWGFFKTIVD